MLQRVAYCATLYFTNRRGTTVAAVEHCLLEQVAERNYSAYSFRCALRPRTMSNVASTPFSLIDYASALDVEA